MSRAITQLKGQATLLYALEELLRLRVARLGAAVDP